jgi:hypothetical protein
MSTSLIENIMNLPGIGWRLNFMRDRAKRLRWPAKNLADIGEAVDVNPTITLVVVGRNDNYGGDFSGRLETTLAWNLQYPFNEAIYVEWNPVPDKPSDAEWLTEKFKQLKVYIVSRERHLKCCTNPKMPMMEYFAKNVGIRRATSDWICLVNADVMIGQDVFKNLGKLKRNRVYGTHYANIRWPGRRIEPKDLIEQFLGDFGADPDLFSVAGNFVLASRECWHKARGYDESLTDRRISCDAHGVAQLYHLGAKPRVIGRHYHLDHPESAHRAVLDHQGQVFDPWEGVPYLNPDNWGQADGVERQIASQTIFIE